MQLNLEKVKSRILVSCFVILFYAGCVSNSGSKPDGKADSSVPDQAYLAVQELDRIFLLEDTTLFERKKEDFLNIYPNSVYVQFVNLLSSKAYLKKNLLNEALDVNTEVQNKTFKANKEIYYLALFESADIYEALEKYDKSLGALTEAEKK